MKKPEAGNWKLGAGGVRRSAGSGILVVALAASCSGLPAAAPPATRGASDLSQVPAPTLTTPTQAVATGLPEATATEEPCLDGATFLDDLTIPDGSLVGPGEEVDKRWAVENSGTCDWGPGYALVRVSGGELGGPAEIDLYPARAGTSAVWQVVFLAPLIPGQYVSEWQAVAPDGTRFGDEVFVDLIVQPRP